MSSEVAQVSMSQRSSHSTIGVEDDELPSSDCEFEISGDGKVRLPIDASYSILKRERSWSYRICVAFAPASLVATGGPPHLIANSPMPASVVIICCGMDVLLVQPFGSDCSSNVSSVVVGESDSIAKPWRST